MGKLRKSGGSAASVIRKAAIVAVSLAVISATGYGVRLALRSPLFLVRIVEVADQPESAPVDSTTVSELAAVPVGQVNLFELDLGEIERRVLSNVWIREVHLTKRFPQTLSISVVFREPRALLEAESGALSYVDSDGKVFGHVSLLYQPDLPLLTGFVHDGTAHIADALRLVQAWEGSSLQQISQLSSIQWDPERGYRALATYPMGVGGALGRVFVDLGQENDADTELTSQYLRLSHVLRYLSTSRIAARQIFADSGKKIVVRTAHGS